MHADEASVRLSRRPFTIRATLTAIAAGACLYVGVIGAYISIVLAPAATGLHDRTEALEQQFGALQDRVTILKDTLRETERASHAASLSAQDLDRIRDMRVRLAPVAEVSAGMRASQRLYQLSPAMRGLLADSAGAESRFAGILQEALDYLVRGDVEGARRRLADASQARDTLIANLSETQRQGLADMVVTERELAARATQVGRVIGIWTLAGMLPIALVVLAVRRRLYIPLAALDRGLARVATGDFATPLPVLREDEVGRLTVQFNQTVALLQARADEAHSRQTNLADRLGRILEHSFNEIYVFDAETLALVQVNQGAQTALGYAPDEYSSLRVLDILGGYDERSFRAMVAPLQHSDRPWIRVEATHVRKGGSSYPVDLAIQLWSMEAPAVYVAIAQDITERRRSETIRLAAQRISEIALATATIEKMFEAIHGVVAGLIRADNFYIALHDAEHGMLSFPYFVDEFDLPPGPKPVGRGLTEYVLRTGQTILVTPEVFDRLAEQGEVERVGAPSVDWVGVPLVADNQTIGVFVVQTYTEGIRYSQADVEILQFVSAQVAMAVARRRADEAVRESQDRLQRILDAAPFGAFLYDLQPDGRLIFTAANQSADRILGVDCTQYVGRTIEEAFPALVQTAIPAAFRRTAAEGVRLDVDQVDYDEQGIRGAFETHALQTGPNRMAVFFSDITERKRAQVALQRERDLVSRIADTSPVGITVLDRDGRITFANEQAARTLGITPENLKQRRFNTPDWRISQYDGSPFPEDELPFLRVMATGQPVFNVGHAIEWPDGRRVLLSVNGAPLFDEYGSIEGVVAALTDVTERVHLEEQFRQAQKMESIGRLAGGVAHDFNNLLTVMLGFTAQAKSTLQDDDPAKLDLDEVENACNRAASLTRQLLAFARRQVIDPRAIDLNVTTHSMDKMLRRLIGEDIELVTVPGDDLWTVWADPGQVQQVLANLVVNARDAMPKGGRLTVETHNVTLDADYASRHAGVVPGDYVMLAVTDTGHGMAPDVTARVFEPFFTTKRSGIGTGLGLATCYGIVKQAGGSIWVASEPGRGTTFTLYLPRVKRPAESLPARESDEAVGGAERILLVEDEDNVRRIAARTLRDAGYTVLEACNGEDALLVAADRLDSIDLVVTDVVMPQMGGRDLAERLLVLRPDLKILFTSGYTEDGIVHRGVLARGVSFLPKPYDRASLTRRVRSMLDGTAP
jgi:PAS domain S-box-containing protein